MAGGRRMMLERLAFLASGALTATAGIACLDVEFRGRLLSSLTKAEAATMPPQAMGRSLTLAPLPGSDVEATYKRFGSVGLPNESHVRLFDAFCVSYDRRLRIPRWVLEHIPSWKVTNPNKKDKVDRAQFDFYEDYGEDPLFRAALTDYFQSGYDRGHMAAAGNHRFDSPAALGQTFNLTNIAPQVGKGFNRDGWNSLEMYIRKIARHSHDLYVLTGPLFLPRLNSCGKKRTMQYPVIGQNNVAVPTHFFKVAAIQEKPGCAWRVVAWVMPNVELPVDNLNLDQFQVPVIDIERAAGFRIFPNLKR